MDLGPGRAAGPVVPRVGPGWSPGGPRTGEVPGGHQVGPGSRALAGPRAGPGTLGLDSNRCLRYRSQLELCDFVYFLTLCDFSENAF